MTSTGPLEGKAADEAAKKFLSLWEKMIWVAFVATLMGLLLGGLQLSWVVLLVVMVLMWGFIVGVLTESAGWLWVKEAAWFILAVAVGAYVGWSTGSDLSEPWAALQLLDDIDFYHHHFPQLTM